MWLFKNKYVHLVLAAGLITYLFLEAQGEGDLFIYFSAAHDLGDGQDFYNANYRGFHYYYSVLFAYFLYLFESLPFYGIKLVWLTLNVALFSHLFILLRNSNFLQALTEKQKNYFLLCVLLFSMRFFHQNIHFAQVSILILWTCIYGLISIENGNTIKGSALLALGINIKLLPLVFLPYLVYRGFFKGFFITLSFYAFSLFLPSLFIGHHYNMDLLTSWYHLINPGNKQHVLDTDERSFHGLSTLLATLFIAHPPDPLAMSIKRNIADVSVENLKVILMSTRLFLMALTLYFLKWPPFRRAQSKQHTFVEVSYILLLIPLIFPHQQHYAFLFSVPAFAVIVYTVFLNFQQFNTLKKRGFIFLLTIIYLSANLTILLGEFNRYYEHFKLLTYGTLLMIPLLFWVSTQLKDPVSGTAK